MTGESTFLPFIGRVNVQNIFATMDYTFYLKNEADKFGRKPIYLNVTVGGERKRISTKIKILESFWDPKESFLLDTEGSHDDYLQMKQIESKITSIRIKHRLAEVPLTMNKFLEALKSAPATFDFIEFYHSIKGIQDLSQATIQKHDGIFDKLKKHWPTLLFADINPKWFDEVRATFAKIEKNGQPTINSNISVIKKYLGIAQSYGIKIGVDLSVVKVGSTGGRIVWLTEDEIKKLSEYYYSSYIPDYYKLTLGYFLTACYTGLRITDIKNRNRDEMLQNYVQLVTHKGKMDLLIAIIPKIHDLINANPELFIKWKSDVNLNDQIKKIAKICGISKKLHFHVGRHSYATNYILRGGNVATLQKVLGHTKISTTMKYMHITETTAADSMMIMQ